MQYMLWNWWSASNFAGFSCCRHLHRLELLRQA